MIFAHIRTEKLKFHREKEKKIGPLNDFVIERFYNAHNSNHSRYRSGCRGVRLLSLRYQKLNSPPPPIWPIFIGIYDSSQDILNIRSLDIETANCHYFSRSNNFAQKNISKIPLKLTNSKLAVRQSAMWFDEISKINALSLCANSKINYFLSETSSIQQWKINYIKCIRFLWHQWMKLKLHV